MVRALKRRTWESVWAWEPRCYRARCSCSGWWSCRPQPVRLREQRRPGMIQQFFTFSYNYNCNSFVTTIYSLHFHTPNLGIRVLVQSRKLFNQILITLLIHHLVSRLKTSKTKSFRASEGGLWWPRQGWGRRGWIGMVRLGSVSIISNLK